MPKTLSEMLESLPAERHARIKAETAREARQIMTLRELRQAFRKTQEAVARELDMGQESISRLERRTDLLLSTMRKYVAAIGGDLKLIAEFPGQPPIQIDALAELGPTGRTRRESRRKHA